jgi:[protein-PII] uridylyltransferase
LESLRSQARQRFQRGATGTQIAGGLSQGFDEIVLVCLEDALQACSSQEIDLLRASAAVTAIGGSGRGETAPYSDVDLLFLYQPEVEDLFARIVAEVVRSAWDSGLKLGHSVRTVAEAVQAARGDIRFATALTDLRPLWGSTLLTDEMGRRFRRGVIQGRVHQFRTEGIAAREAERQDSGGAVLQLEPDLKRSFGGLRDLHLIRWIGFAHYGVSEIDSLRLRGVLSRDDARRLAAAHDYLLGLRINLHFHSGKPDDVLTRDHQLRIAQERSIAGAGGQLPVERFMREYFGHSLAVAEIADRFVALHQRPSWPRRWFDFVMTIRIDDIYRIGPKQLDIPRRFRAAACSTLEGALAIYLTAARYRVEPASAVTALIREQAPHYSERLSVDATRTFLQILATPGKLGRLLRSMYHAGVLEAVLPEFRHTRCLLQFNQYHSYTVDEHTLRAIEIVESFEGDSGPVGQAYRDIRRHEILHLALLLHDAGKGFPEDHSEVGRRLAEQTATRLQLTDSRRELLVFLVHRHLLMAELAFRRDATDPKVLLIFSHDVGSPETLTLLFVLTAADLCAVGQGVWTSWKAELLVGLYERTMQWLSGQSHLLQETARLDAIRREVLLALAGRQSEDSTVRRLDSVPAHYLLATPPERIAADLQIVAERRPEDIHVEGRYETETDTVAYRVITHENVVRGCFHKLTGVLTAQRMEILAAGICTSADGVIIDSYRVVDHDYEGQVPAFRIDEVAAAIRRVLTGQVAVEKLLHSGRRFGPSRFRGPLSNLQLRVVLDNDWSDRYTIIEVFAHDRPGLLYLISKTIFELQLSVARAQISTHFDQVVDAFYVTSSAGRKIEGEERLKEVHDRLTAEISRFEQSAQAETSPLPGVAVQA